MKYDINKDNQGKKYDDDFFILNKTVKNLKFEKELMEKLFPYFWTNKSRIIISCLDEEKVDPLIDMICEGKTDKILSYLSNNSKDDDLTNKDNDKMDKLRKVIIGGDILYKIYHRRIRDFLNRLLNKKMVKDFKPKILKDLVKKLDLPRSNLIQCFYRWRFMKKKNNNNKNVYKDKIDFTMKQKFNFEIINLDEKKKENSMHKESKPINDQKYQFNTDIIYNNIFDFKIIIPENSVFKEKNFKDIKIECKQQKDNCFELTHLRDSGSHAPINF
jgi:hypothetical protein